MKVLFEKAKAKNARVQMSEAFITSVFLALSGGFQDAYTYFMKYFRMHRQETWY